MMQLLSFIVIFAIGYFNYQLTKSYWCNEGIWGKDVHEQ